jgi:hypothetical protein
MTSYVSDRDREQVVIDVENLKSISRLQHKNMGLLPEEINILVVSIAHFICRFLISCASFARAPPLDFIRAGHACVAILDNAVARSAGVTASSEAFERILTSSGNVLMAVLYVIMINIMWFDYMIRFTGSTSKVPCLYCHR